jgi:Kef-type K+ transport system membrane component KefB
VTLTTVGTLVLIGVVAVLSRVLSELAVPDVLIEIVLGIIIGPAVLAIAHPDSVVTAFSDMGLSYLMFLAGFELDLARIRGRSLQLAAMGWGISLGIALLVALVLVTIGTVLDAVVVGLALTTTALGTLLADPARRRPPRRAVRQPHDGIGSVGEFGPIVGVAILLDHRDPGLTALLLVLFVVVAVATTLAAARPHPPKVIRLLHRHLQSSTQLPIRVAVLFIFGLVYLAFRLGLDVLLGAFAAGIVVRLFVRGEDSGIVKGKLEAIGFGFLVPIFFIVSGMNFHLTALTSSPSALLRVPLFLVLLLVVRGTPALLRYRRDLPPRLRPPLALFSATALPLVVVITTIGVAEGRMRPVNAAALVGAGMLSVLLYPMLARLLLGRAESVSVAGIGIDGATSATGQPGIESDGSLGQESGEIRAVGRVPNDGDTSNDNPH